jgi:DNA-binding IclR family transcriptional regulator
MTATKSSVPRGAADRIAYLLKKVAAGPSQFTLGELAASAGLPASSVHRLLQSLVRSGLVERGEGQTYRPGRELHRLASQLVARFDLVRCARPFLEKLVANWHETAVLCTYSPVMRVAIIADVVMTPNPLRFAVERGGEIQLPWGSLGRAILAFLPQGDAEAIMREGTVGDPARHAMKSTPNSS